MAEAVVDLRETMRKVTVKVKVKGVREVTWRLKVALWVIRLGVWISGMGIEISDPDIEEPVFEGDTMRCTICEGSGKTPMMGRECPVCGGVGRVRV